MKFEQYNDDNKSILEGMTGGNDYVDTLMKVFDNLTEIMDELEKKESNKKLVKADDDLYQEIYRSYT